MRPAWVSRAALAAALAWASGCGGQGPSWQPVEATAAAVGGGLRVSLVSTRLEDHAEPWRGPRPGMHCVVYELRVRSTDGGRHDLRPDAFRAAGAAPVDAVGQCFGPQLEPTWVGGEPRTVWVTIPEPSQVPATLMWRAP